MDKILVKSADQLQVSRHVNEGVPFVEIVKFAKENDVDLIVLGTHGRGAIAHMLMGSVAERVVRKAYGTFSDLNAEKNVGSLV